VLVHDISAAIFLFRLPASIHSLWFSLFYWELEDFRHYK